MKDHYARVQAAADFILSRTSLRPQVAVVLGSGLGAFADELTQAVRLPYAEIPNFPQSTVEGHAGALVIGEVGELAVAAMQGRVHFYEGYSMDQVVFPMRVFARLGIKAVVLTNAAGAINPAFEQGCLVALTDHINMQGANPLIGTNEARFGPRFFDMSAAYEPAYRKLALEKGRELGIPMQEGVYIAVSGPSYETPAEIRAFRTLGADMVGMSTVAEVIAARHMGIKVLAISCVTNAAAGVSAMPINHEEVMEVGNRVRGQFVGLLKAVLPEIAGSVAGSQ